MKTAGELRFEYGKRNIFGRLARHEPTCSHARVDSCKNWLEKYFYRKQIVFRVDIHLGNVGLNVMDAYKEKNSIILIHGTWSQDADWIKTGSPLREAIQRDCPKWRIHENQFIWSGNNTVQARREAADELSKLINDKPASQFIMIAHSHGGNIALQSLRRSNENAIKGIICINTPFMNFLKKDIRNLSDITMFSLFTFILLASWLSLCVHFPQTFWYFIPVNVLAPILFFIILYFVSEYLNSKFVQEWISSKWVFYQKFMDHPPISATPILCINSGADEAFSLLSAIDGLSNLPIILLNRYTQELVFPILFTHLILLSKLSSYFKIHETYIYTAIEKTPISFILNLLHVPDFSTFGIVFKPIIYNWVIIKNIVILAEAICLGSLYSFGLYLSFAILSIIFGFPFRVVAGAWNEPLMPFFARIFVSLTPINCQNVSLRLYDVADGDKPLHSHYYNDPKVIKDIVDWINRI